MTTSEYPVLYVFSFWCSELHYFWIHRLVELALLLELSSPEFRRCGEGRAVLSSKEEELKVVVSDLIDCVLSRAFLGEHGRLAAKRRCLASTIQNCRSDEHEPPRLCTPSCDVIASPYVGSLLVFPD